MIFSPEQALACAGVGAAENVADVGLALANPHAFAMAAIKTAHQHRSNERVSETILFWAAFHSEPMHF